MKREIKFKIWLPGINKMTYAHTLEELMNWETEKWTNGSGIFLQYTGLKERNGKEIYEGDLYKCGKSIGEIKYKEDSFIIDWIFNKDSWNEHLNRHLYGEVIGNIYENPDL